MEGTATKSSWCERPLSRLGPGGSVEPARGRCGRAHLGRRSAPLRSSGGRGGDPGGEPGGEKDHKTPCWCITVGMLFSLSAC